MLRLYSVLVILITISVPVISNARSEAITLLKKSTDYNGDGVVDTFRFHDKTKSDHSMIRKEADLNGDGKIDFWVAYSFDGHLHKTVYEWDLNKDTLKDKKEVRFSNGEVTIDLDSNFNGLYDWKKSIKIDSNDSEHFIVKRSSRPGEQRDYFVLSTKKMGIIQSDSNIDYGHCSLEAEDFLNIRKFEIFDTILDYDLDRVRGRSRRGTFTTSYGQEIDETCFDIYGKNRFLKVVQRSIAEGAACLAKLNTEQSLEHLHKLTDLLDGRFGGPRIDCRKKALSAKWDETTVARGSIGVGQIWLRPDYKERYFDTATSVAAAETSLSSTLFHEILHNIGYPHNEGVEYVYTCQRCCHVKPNDTRAERNAACNICKTNYGPNDQVSYLRELGVAQRLSSTILFREGLREALNSDAHSSEMLNFLYEQSDDDFLKGVGRARAIKRILNERSEEISEEGKRIERLQYIPYQNFIAKDESGAFEKIANAHEENFSFLNLKTRYQALDRRDPAKREERRVLAETMYDIFVSFDVDSMDLNGEDEIQKRKSVQDIAESYFQALGPLKGGSGFLRLLKYPRRPNTLISKMLKLKRFIRSNSKALEELGESD